MELTPLGRAYMATASDAERDALMAIFKRRRGAQWVRLKADVDAAMRRVCNDGFCAAAWQPEVVAVATPFVTRHAAGTSVIPSWRHRRLCGSPRA